MGSSGAVITTISLTLIAGCFATDASRNRITFRKYRTNYRVDSWDDNRDDPYRVTFWKFGLKSVYTFDVSGNIKTLTARDVKYSFDTEVGTRMLVDMDDDAVTDIEVDPSEIPCSDCSVTWNTLCDGGIADVCYLDINPYDTFDEDALDSVRRMCSGFGAACASSALDACDGQCTGMWTVYEAIPDTGAILYLCADVRTERLSASVHVRSAHPAGVSPKQNARLNRLLLAFVSVTNSFAVRLPSTSPYRSVSRNFSSPSS